MKRCATCDFEYDDAYDGCPQCAHKAADKAAPRNAAFNPRMAVGLAGVAFLFVGVFVPIVSLPIVGSVNYFNNGKGDGTFLLGLSLISALLVVIKRYRGLLVTGGLSLLMLGYSFYALNQRLAEVQTSMEKELAGNPFAGLAQAAMQSVQLQWGWAVLVIGAVLLVVAGLMNGARPAVAPAATPVPPTAKSPMTLGILSEGAKLAGHAVYYADGVYSVEGSGPVGRQFLKMHHERGQIEWSTPQTRAWALRVLAEPDAGEDPDTSVEEA